MIRRKINTKQLTRIKVTTAHGNKRFYFRYYCPDLQKDNIRKFASTEADAKVLREQIKEKQVLGPSSPVYGLTFGKLKHIFLSAQQKRAHNKEITKSYLNDFTGAWNILNMFLEAKHSLLIYNGKRLLTRYTTSQADALRLTVATTNNVCLKQQCRSRCRC